jgi:hypothetical protein
MSETLSLRGKTVAVHMRDRAGAAPIVLKECMLETRAGRHFLVGVSVPAQASVSEWTDGVRRAVAWDAVDDYLLFDSPDDYYARCQAAPPAQAQAPAQQMQTQHHMPMFESPAGAEGFPVEPSGIAIEPETPLDVGSVVLSYSQGRWWRAEVVALEDDDLVRIHFPGWDEKWDVSVPRGELQVYLGASLQSDDNLA